MLLASLLFSGDAPGPATEADRRILDPEQIVPVRGDAGAERRAAALRLLMVRLKMNDRGEMKIVPRGGVTNDRGEMKMPPRGAIDLAPAAWLLITLLFLLERVISYGKTKT